MCVGYMQILHHFIWRSWAPTDFGILGWRDPGTNPLDTEGWLYILKLILLPFVFLWYLGFCVHLTPLPMRSFWHTSYLWFTYTTRASECLTTTLTLDLKETMNFLSLKKNQNCLWLIRQLTKENYHWIVT